MSDEPDIGEAVDYILSERPRLDEDDVWAVLMELGTPPPERSDDLAVALARGARPKMKPRHIRVILREWRAYASLAREPDWQEGED